MMELGGNCGGVVQEKTKRNDCSETVFVCGTRKHDRQDVEMGWKESK